jgi:hypothetical protein
VVINAVRHFPAPRVIVLKAEMEQIGGEFLLLFCGEVGYLPHQFSHVHGGTMASGGWICNPGDKVRLKGDDVIEIEPDGLGRALLNPGGTSICPKPKNS